MDFLEVSLFRIAKTILNKNGEVLCGIHLLAVAVFIKRDVKLPVQSVFYSPVLALVLENYICVVLLLPLENGA